MSLLLLTKIVSNLVYNILLEVQTALGILDEDGL